MSLPRLDDFHLTAPSHLPAVMKRTPCVSCPVERPKGRLDEGGLQLRACEEVGPQSTKRQGTDSWQQPCG